MRRPFRPRASRAWLAAAPVHVVARSYPEVLGPMRALGVDPARDGATPVAELPDAERVVDALERETAWRPAP